MFGSIGGAEFVLILVVALLVFSPRKLPQIGKTLGKAISEFRGAAQDFRTNLEREVDLKDLLQHLPHSLDDVGGHVETGKISRKTTVLAIDDQGVEPSRTAIEKRQQTHDAPTGRRPGHLNAGAAPHAQLNRRWNRSTRPAVSTNFCLPV